MAVKAGASRVHACEHSGSVLAIARDVLSGNKMSEKVNLIHCHSTNLFVPKSLPNRYMTFYILLLRNCNRVEVVVTETVDAGLLGESIVPTLRHAWKELLLPPSEGGHVIPAGATVYAAIVECETIRRQSRLVIL